MKIDFNQLNKINDPWIPSDATMERINAQVMGKVIQIKEKKSDQKTIPITHNYRRWNIQMAAAVLILLFFSLGYIIFQGSTLQEDTLSHWVEEANNAELSLVQEIESYNIDEALHEDIYIDVPNFQQ